MKICRACHLKTKWQPKRQSKPGIDPPPEPTLGKRICFWIGALVLFVLSSMAGDWAEDNKDVLALPERVNKQVEDSLISAYSRGCADVKKSEVPDCIAEQKSAYEQLKKVTTDPPEHEELLPSKPVDYRTQAIEKSIWLPLIKAFWALMAILCWIGKVFASAVILEGCVCLAIWAGRKSKVLDDKWDDFGDKLKDKLAELVESKASAASGLALFAAVAGGGVASAYLSTQTSVHAKIGVEGTMPSSGHPGPIDHPTLNPEKEVKVTFTPNPITVDVTPSVQTVVVEIPGLGDLTTNIENIETQVWSNSLTVLALSKSVEGLRQMAQRGTIVDATVYPQEVCKRLTNEIRGVHLDRDALVASDLNALSSDVKKTFYSTVKLDWPWSAFTKDPPSDEELARSIGEINRYCKAVAGHGTSQSTAPSTNQTAAK